MKTKFGSNMVIGSLLLVMAGLSSGCVMGGRGRLIEDPEGRFTYRVSSELREIPTDGSYARWKSTDPDIDSFVAVGRAAVEGDALDEAFGLAGIDRSRLEIDGVAGFGHWRLERYLPENGTWYATAYQYRGNSAYAFIVRGGKDSDPDSLPTPVFGILTSFRFTEDAEEVFEPDTFAELEAYVDTLVRQTGGSISIAVMKDGKIAYEYAAGSAAPGRAADSGTAYQWGSITKLATATAVMQLVERGEVDLDAAVDAYLPEFGAGRFITVRQLLGHQSGLADRPNNHLVGFPSGRTPSIEDVWNEYAPSMAEPDYAPGTSVVYSNMNYLALGMIVQRVTGEELTARVRREVFDPLGMRATAHASADLPAGTVEARSVIPIEELPMLLDELAAVGYGRDDVVDQVDGPRVYLNTFDILPCWGGVKGTAADAVRFGQLVVGRGEAPGGRVLDRRTVREMVAPQKTLDGDKQIFGLGWKVGVGARPAYVEHSGGGPGIDSLLRVYPNQGLAIAVMGNVVGYGSGRILEYAYELVK